MRRWLMVVSMLIIVTVSILVFKDYRDSLNTDLYTVSSNEQNELNLMRRGINIGNSLDACDWNHFGSVIESGFQAAIVYNSNPWTAWDASQYVYFDEKGKNNISWEMTRLNSVSSTNVGNIAIQLVNHNSYYEGTEVDCSILSAEISYPDGSKEKLSANFNEKTRLIVKNEVTDYIYVNFENKNMKTSNIIGATINVSLEISGYHVDKAEQILAMEQSWGNPLINEKIISVINDGGFDAVRVPVTYFNHISENGTIDSEYLDRIEKIVDWILDKDMYCIIDMQHDTGNDGWIKASSDNYEKNKAIVRYIFLQIAERFKEKDEHLILEGLNEVVNDKTDWFNIPTKDLKVMNDWNQLFVETVRSTGGKNIDRYLLVNTYAALPIEECLSKFRMPKDSANDKILVGIHCYFSKNNMEKNFKVISRYSTRYHFVIGEFAFNKDMENREQLVENFISYADKLGIPVIWWDDGGSGYGILDRNKLEWSHIEVIDAIMGK